MEKKVVLHIGMHKTGTSSIQGALGHEESADLLYPLTGRDLAADTISPAHHELARSVVSRYRRRNEQEPEQTLWSRLRAEIQESNHALNIVSSELFWPAGTAEVERIASYLDGFDVSVVLYVRNHWDYMVSSFKQHVKGGAAPITSLRQLMEEKLWMIDYARHIQNWESSFAVDVRIYDKVKRNLIVDFGEAVGLQINSNAKSRNISPDDATIRIVLGLNVMKRRLSIPSGTLIDRARANLIANRQPGRWASRVVGTVWRRPIGTDQDRAWLRNTTADTRARFLERYIKDEDRSYFAF